MTRETRRSALASMFLAMYFAFAPSRIDPWRLEPQAPPARTMPIGEPALPLFSR